MFRLLVVSLLQDRWCFAPQFYLMDAVTQGLSWFLEKFWTRIVSRCFFRSAVVLSYWGRYRWLLGNFSAATRNDILQWHHWSVSAILRGATSTDALLRVMILVRSGYFISPVPSTSMRPFPIHHLGRYPIRDLDECLTANYILKFRKMKIYHTKFN